MDLSKETNPLYRSTFAELQIYSEQQRFTANMKVNISIRQKYFQP